MPQWLQSALCWLVLVEGNPLEKPELVADQNNFKIIMKDGVIYKQG